MYFLYLHFKKMYFNAYYVFLQYYAMKSKNLYLLIFYLNNIHRFNTLKYNLWILSTKKVFPIGILYHVYAFINFVEKRTLIN